jgi:hypothetical protein
MLFLSSELLYFRIIILTLQSFCKWKEPKEVSVFQTDGIWKLEYTLAMEKEPNFESSEALKERVVESLKDNPANVSLLVEYLETREREVKNSRQGLALNIEIAEIYRDAGLLESAKEAFVQAAEQAWQEQDDALYEQLMSEADRIDS